MADKLSEYKSKRDFGRTPEPAGKTGEVGDGAQGRFVVHEHHARNLHWDLRLEHDGVLVSWAVPKGIPFDPKRNNLAVHVEDHPLDYVDFEGEIPKGAYGAGKIEIWDSGTYAAEKFRSDEVIATFAGERLNGKYALFQTKGKNWMIHRMDPPPDPSAESMPERIAPMLAKLAPLPSDEQKWAYEIKWDGVRAICFVEGGRARFQGRNLNDVSARYPELKTIGRELGATAVVLDGEVVAFDEQGRPNFGLLQHRMHLASDTAVRRRMKDIPVTYVIFDLLYCNGHSTAGLPYVERRKLLEQLELDGERWRTPAYHTGDGAAVLEASQQQQLEGIVAKRLDSTYEPGARNGTWRKVKNQLRQEFVVGGWLPGKGARSATIGSLALGYYDGERLEYAGNVGTGFNEATLAELTKRLEKLETSKSPFEGRQPPRETHFVAPEMVVEVAFGEWTKTGTIRHSTFEGLRDDKRPQEVVLEREDSAELADR